jgi:esterase/lipase superfamily enzyme
MASQRKPVRAKAKSERVFLGMMAWWRSVGAGAMPSNAAMRAAARGVAAGLILAALAGCAKAPEAVIGVDGTIPVDQVPGVKLHEIFIATSRARDPDPAILFSGERAFSTSLAKVTVSIPPDHVPGSISRPRQLPPDPRKDFVVLNPRIFDSGESFIADIDAALALRPEGEREVLVFVHGYNTTTTAAVMRISQFVQDSGFTGVPVLFTWASRGKTVDYVYDMNSALQARGKLLETSDLLSNTKAESFSILAHSMGNLLTVEAIRQAKLQGNFNRKGKLRTVILASPDIDLDLFRQQIAVLPEEQRNFYVLISRDDRALAFSRRIAGGIDRVGDATPAELAGIGVTVIDLSKVSDTNSLNHSKFADAPEVVQLIGKRLNAGDQLHTSEATSGTATFEDLTIVRNANVISLSN